MPMSPIESTAPTGGMLMAFELGQRSWKLGFTVGMGQRPRVRQIPAGAVDALATEITRAKKRLGLSADAPVTSCYEAGRDGFWLHRYLMAMGVTNYVSSPRASKSIGGPDGPRRTVSISLAS